MIFWLLCFQLCFSKVNHVFVERIECFFLLLSFKKFLNVEIIYEGVFPYALQFM